MFGGWQFFVGTFLEQTDFFSAAAEAMLLAL